MKKNVKTLIITDVQNDFMPGHVLSAPHANEIIPIINRLIPKFEHVIATLDWHPPHHISFAQTHEREVGEVIFCEEVEQILWPIHCVENTVGASFAKGLQQDRIERIFKKGIDPYIDSYSSFFDQSRRRSTGLEKYLREHHLNELYFVGIATDYCVLYSVLDAIDLGFETILIRDACRAINLYPDDERKAIQSMYEKGAKIALSTEI